MQLSPAFCSHAKYGWLHFYVGVEYLSKGEPTG